MKRVVAWRTPWKWRAFGRDHPAKTLIVAGVRFMGETAKILSPDKTILMPDLDASCSLDLACPPGRLRRLLRCASGPHRGGVCEYQCCGQGTRGLDW